MGFIHLLICTFAVFISTASADCSKVGSECTNGGTCEGVKCTCINNWKGVKCEDPPTCSDLKCPAGEYFDPKGCDNKRPGCAPCPSGHSCAGECKSEQPCPAGTFSAGGSDKCTPCAAGSYTTNEKAGKCTKCPAGSSCTEKADTHTPCPAGSFSAINGSATCTLCPKGTFNKETGQQKCTDCGVNQKCSSKGLKAPELCFMGTIYGYQPNTGQKECIPCPAGVACPTNGSSVVACEAGTFSLAGHAACRACFPGSFCATTSLLPQVCPAGTFSIGGAEACTPCKSGFYTVNPGSIACSICPPAHACANATAPPVECRPNEYAFEGVCEECPNNTFRSAGGLSCTRCPGGWSCSGSGMQPCPAGTYSADGVNTCSPCDPGFYSPANSTLCHDCPANHYCRDPAEPKPCPAGQVSAAGSNTKCELCAVKGCVQSSDLVYGCPFGQVTVGPGDCSDCPAGAQCVGIDKDGIELAVQLCEHGWYSAKADLFCHICPAGWSCSTSQAVALCKVGTYSPAGHDKCETCPLGHFCGLKAGAHAALPCPEGQYRKADQTNCNMCPAGYECEGGGSAPCMSGEYSPLGVGICLSCPQGYACAGPTFDKAVACEPGHYSVYGDHACRQCPKGFECPVGLDLPVACAPGLIAPDAGAKQCETCPDGKICTGTGKAGAPGAPMAPVTCVEGEYRSSNMLSCAPCPRGWACPALDGSNNYPCALGHWSGGGAIECTKCEEGSACEFARFNSSVVCDSASYSNESAIGCLECPSGHSCKSSGEPERCAKGFFSSPKESGCYPCPAGYSCAHSGVVTRCEAGEFSHALDFHCQACTSGYYSSPGAKECKVCPPGQYTAGPGRGRCDQCPAGFACPGLKAQPKYVFVMKGCKCANEKIMRLTSGYNTPDKCYEKCRQTEGCISFFMWDRLTLTIGGEEVNGVCDLAKCSFGARPEQIGEDFPKPSMPYPQHDLTNCPVFFRNDLITASYELAVYTEFEQNQHFKTVMPQQCGFGFYSKAGASECTRCGAGYACPAGSTAPTPWPTMCTPGYYCDIGATFPANDSSFPIRTYRNVTLWEDEKKLLDKLVDLESPWYDLTCEVSKGVKQRCTPNCYGVARYGVEGHWHTVDLYQKHLNRLDNDKYHGDKASEAWITCDYREFGLTEKHPDPKAKCQCADNVPTESEVVHRACPPGTYGLLSGAVAQNQTCMPCKAGNYCPLGSSEVLTVVCPLGYYCPERSEHPEPCPYGTYSQHRGAVTLEECDRCPEGYWCDVEDFYFGKHCGGRCHDPSVIKLRLEHRDKLPNDELWQGYFQTPQKCLPGFYCVEGKNADQCPGGTYTGYVYLAASLQDCLPCPAGYYCPTAREKDDLVQLQKPPPYMKTYMDGLRLPSGNKVAMSMRGHPIPCEPGKYNPYQGADNEEDCQPCPEGYACPKTASTRMDPVVCSMGHYCPQGTKSPNENKCPPGKYTSMEDVAADQKSRLYFSAGDCVLCPAGKTCKPGTGGVEIKYKEIQKKHDKFDLTFGLRNDGRTWQTCIRGAYCPPGTPYEGSVKQRETKGLVDIQYVGGIPCPKGTYANKTGLVDLNLCRICPAGMVCDCFLKNKPGAPGCTEPSDPCPLGKYCPAGTPSLHDAPLCRPGTYGAEEKLTRVEECTNCTAGAYCDKEGMTKPVACKPGTYQNLTGTTACVPCTSGWTCAGGSAMPVPCQPGTFSELGATQCSPCEVGYYCHATTTDKEKMYRNPCPAGMFCSGGNKDQPSLDKNACKAAHYCPERTTRELVCPAGTYNPFTGRGSEAECLVCPKGLWCAQGSTAGDPCAKGHYCLAGSKVATAAACPPGYYRASTRGEALSSCAHCPAGTYCPDPAMLTPLECPLGAYCEGGSIVPELCPPGTYAERPGLHFGEDCSPCPNGKFCLGNSSAPSGVCAPGFYCLKQSRSPSPRKESDTGGKCPKGHYCPANTTDPIACPAGTYNSAEGQSEPEHCVTCNPGMYCAGKRNAEPDGPCKPGYYCPADSYASIPALKVSPPGSFSRGGASNPTECPRGKYNGKVAQSECKACEAGTVCLDTGMLEPLTCPKGHYCNGGWAAATPCPSSTYNNVTGQKTLSKCLDCPAGSYCTHRGSALPTGKCAPGFFCPAESIDRYGRLSICAGGVENSSSPCPEGFYCPSGSAQPTPCPVGKYSNSKRQSRVEQCAYCDAGRYCDKENATAPTGDCDPGYYCLRGVKSKSPTVGLREELEDFKAYWKAVHDAVDSNLGRHAYGNLGRRLSVTDPPTRTVPPELIKDTRTVVIGGDVCPAGHYCGKGTFAPVPCPEGKYTLKDGLDTSDACTECKAGLYCAEGSPGLACPMGHYCPSGTNASILACPVGHYQNKTHATDISACKPCPPGYYCHTGTGHPSGPCHAGFFCTGKSRVPNPVRGVGGVCTAGHYCPEGSGEPQKCPPGTYRNHTFGNSSAQCLPCDPGWACKGSGLTAPTEKCEAGYYCTGGASTPQQKRAPIGKYSLEGAAYPVECPRGKYQDAEASKSCKPCVAGKICAKIGMTAQEPCPVARYCDLANNSWTSVACPRGTYQDKGGLKKLDECLPCPAGKYCDHVGLDKPAGDCEAGFLCTGGALDREGRVELCGARSLCPAGSYCESGVVAAAPCPPGTYSSIKGLKKVAECTPCDAGKTCEAAGLQAPDGDCGASYMCRGAVTATPKNKASRSFLDLREGFCVETPSQALKGTCTALLAAKAGHTCASLLAKGVDCHCACKFQDQELPSQLGSQIGSADCPKGHFCPKGSVVPQPCGPGTFSTEVQRVSQSECTNCPKGSYCDQDDPTQTEDCPIGYYCPAKSSYEDEHPCPAGTFAKAGSYSESSQCETCPIGHFCASGSSKVGASSVTPEPCDEGFYCDGGAKYPNPKDKACWRGFTCPKGTTAPEQCTLGKYCTKSFDGRKFPPRNCAAGYLCTNFSYTPAPFKMYNKDHFDNPEAALYMGGPCPKGHYCPSGATAPVPCPVGTYSNAGGLRSATDCSACVWGKRCNKPGLTAWDGSLSLIGMLSDCPAKRYCPSNRDHSTQPCTTGHRCPGGDRERCVGGEYQDEEGKVACKTCPPGSQCPHGDPVVTPQPCEEGFYCPNKTPNQYKHPCPIGTFSNQKGLISAAQCTNCTEGFFCDRQGITGPVAPCPKGFVCPKFTKERGTFPCPHGTYNDKTGQINISTGCVPCPRGLFCAGLALTKPSGNCSGGFLCSEGNHETAPSGDPSKVSGDDYSAYSGPCPKGYYCPKGSLKPIECPPGSYCPQQSIHDYKCPKGYFSAKPKQTSLDACLANKCSLGHFCGEGVTKETPCPGGTSTAEIEAPGPEFCTICRPGQFCPPNSTASLYCTEGYYCPPGTATPTLSCPPGYFCEANVSFPTPCPAGTYQSRTRQTTCEPCPKGYYCEEASLYPSVCPLGHFCGAKSSTPVPCPPGKYSDVTLRSNLLECKACPPGKYCHTAGLSTPTELCSAGYYCPPGADAAKSVAPDCVNRTLNESNPNGSKASYDDVSCPRGPRNCKAGFFCPAGSTQPEPNVCPVGKYCLDGAPAGMDCPLGFYADKEGQTECKKCEKGYWCDSLKGGSSRRVACPKGTYNRQEGMTSPERCLPCGKPVQFEGHHCPTEATVDPVPCRGGTYCPSGSILPTPCPPGNYCPPKRRAPSKCSKGHYCPANSTTQIPCPTGHYCIENQAQPEKCPPGQYFDKPGQAPTGMGKKEYRLRLYGPGMGGGDVQAQALAYPCMLCPGGHKCAWNTSTPTSTPVECGEGFYCPKGTIKPILCPSGFYCPRGSAKPKVCEAGTYCDPASALCTECKVCPQGHYCPEGEYPILCPFGTVDSYVHSGITGMDELIKEGETREYKRKTENETCLACVPGTAGDHPDRTECRPCQQGYECFRGATTWTPTKVEKHNGRRCQPGHYCPESSAAGRPCSAGTFNTLFQQWNESSCLPCQAQRYQPERGQSRCLLCPSGSAAPAGSTGCTCVGAHRSLQKGTGSCLCTPRHESVYVDIAGIQSVNVDSNGESNCVPIDYDVCMFWQVRNANGDCVRPEEYCKGQCGKDGGEFVPEFGYCDCGQPSNEERCGARDCTAAAPLFVGAPPLDNSIKAEVLKMDMTLVRGELCSEPGCRVSMIAMGATSMRSVTEPMVGMHVMSAMAKSRRRRILSGVSTKQPVLNDGEATTTTPSNKTSPTTTTRHEDNPKWPSDTKKCQALLDSNHTCEQVSKLLQEYFGVNRKHVNRLNDPKQNEPFPCPQCRVCRSRPSLLPHKRRWYLRYKITSKPKFDFFDNEGLPNCYFGHKGLDPTKDYKTSETGHVLVNHCLEIGNGICNQERNTAACGWDGGDCNGWEDASMCLQQGDTVLFELEDGEGNKHYPVYVKDSLLNTNDQFDYSPFTTLAADSKAQRLTDRILAFTFNENGTYVFAHSSDPSHQTVVTVKGSPCDVKVAPKTSASLSGLKAPQQKDVAIKLVERPFHERASNSLSAMTWSSSRSSSRRRLSTSESTSVASIDTYTRIATYVDMITIFTIVVLLILLVCLLLFGWFNKRLHTKRRRERTQDARELLLEKNENLRYQQIEIDTVTEQELIAQTQHETTMQVVKVMQDMTGHTKHSKQSFKDIHGEFDDIIEGMKQENNGLRQLLAATLLKSGGTEQIEKTLRTQIETDVASRTIHSGRFAAALAKIIKVVYSIDGEVKSNAKRCTKDILLQLSKTDDKGMHSADVSEKLTVILDGVVDISVGVKELKKLKESESQRGEVADAMYGAARYTNILNPDSALSRSLQMMAEAVKDVDESREEITMEMEKFVEVAEETCKTLGETRGEFKEGFSKALEMHNPVETKNVQRAFYSKSLTPMNALTVALKKLLRLWPQTKRMLAEHVPQVQDAQERVRHELDLRAMRLHKGIEEDMEADDGEQRMTAAELRKRRGDLIELELDGDDDLNDFDQLELEFDKEELELEAETKVELDELFLGDDKDDNDECLLDLEIDDDDLDGLDMDDMLRQQLLDQNALQKEAIEKALAEERIKAEVDVKNKLNTRRRAKRKKQNINLEDEALEAELLQQFADEFEELDLQQQMELDELENEIDLKLDNQGMGDPELEEALKDLDDKFEFEVGALKEDHFKEMGIKLGFDEDVLDKEMEEFKLELENDRMEQEDKVEKEFNANLQLLEAGLQKAITMGDIPAQKQAELQMEQLRNDMEKEQLALARDFDIAMDEKLNETKARLMIEFKEDLMKTQEGLEMLEEQEAELESYREQLSQDKDDATFKIAEKHGGIEEMREKVKEGMINKIKNEHAEQREKLEEKKKLKLDDVQNRLENAEDDWDWEDALQGKIKTMQKEQGEGGDAIALINDVKALSMEQLKEKNDMEKLLGAELQEELKLIDKMTDDDIPDPEAGGVPLDEDAAAKVRKKFNKSEATRKRTLHAEKMKKKAKLKQRLEKKRRALRDKQREDLKAKEKLASEGLRMQKFEMEMTGIQQLMESGKIEEEKVGEAIERALHERHRIEAAELCHDQFQEKQQRLQDALQDLQHETQLARIELMASFDENTTEAERKQALAALDIKFEIDLGRRKQIVLSDFEAAHQQMELMQSTQHMDEITEGYKRLASEEEFRNYLLKKAKKQREEMDDFQSKLEQQKREKIEMLRREAEERTRMLEAKTAADLSRLELEHEEKLDAERRRAFEALTKKKDKMMSHQEQQYRAELAAARGMPEAQLQLLKKKFEQDKRRVNRMLVTEKRKQEARLQDMLDKRKARMYKRRQEEARRKIAESEAAAAKAIKDLEEKTKATLEIAKNLDEQTTNKIKDDLAHTRTMSIGVLGKMSLWAKKAKRARKAKLETMSPEQRRDERVKAKEKREEKAQAKKTKEDPKKEEETKEAAAAPDAKEQKEAEPESRAQRLERAREARAEKERKEAEKEEELKLDLSEMLKRMDNVWQLLSDYGNSNSPYRDPQDQNKANEGTLELANREVMDKASEKGLKFAERIAESMGFGPSATGFTAIAILPAAKLEKNGYFGNAYRNSIQYDHDKKTLYLRADILADLSQVALVVTHTFAHLTIDPDGSSLHRDNEPKFQQLYLSALQYSYQLMFLDATEPTSKPSAAPAEGADAASATSTAAETKTEAKTQEAKQNPVALAQRMQEYASALQQHQEWKAERLKATGPTLPISPEQVHEQTVSSLRDGIDASDQDVIHSALTFRANLEILEQLKENLKVAAKSGDHMLWKMIKGKVEKAELRTEMAKIQTRKASIVSDTFVLALKRVS